MSPTTTHPFDHLRTHHPHEPLVAIEGSTPPNDPDYGWCYDTVAAVLVDLVELLDEVDFSTIRTHEDGSVLLVSNRGVVVGSARMSSHHADAHLVVGDPPEVDRPAPLLDTDSSDYGRPETGRW